MIKRFLTTCLAALALGAQAAPITFFDVKFEATAIAITADGPPGFATQTSPPDSTPLSVSADSFGVVDFAIAGAIAGPGVLTTSAEALGRDGVVSAVASAHFSGSFLNGGALNLNIGFTPFDFALDAGTATTSLFVLFISNGVTLYEDFLSDSRSFQFVGDVGTTSRLELTLTSDANVGFPLLGAGGASSFGVVTFEVVPIPATVLLVLLGLLAIGVARQARGPGLRPA